MDDGIPEGWAYRGVSSLRATPLICSEAGGGRCLASIMYKGLDNLLGEWFSPQAIRLRSNPLVLHSHSPLDHGVDRC